MRICALLGGGSSCCRDLLTERTIHSVEFENSSRSHLQATTSLAESGSSLLLGCHGIEQELHRQCIQVRFGVVRGQQVHVPRAGRAGRLVAPLQHGNLLMHVRCDGVHTGLLLELGRAAEITRVLVATSHVHTCCRSKLECC